jgi:succinate-semialdehyde dehydrogenase/glutarate-semialdehyde dehydrogenase
MEQCPATVKKTSMELGGNARSSSLTTLTSRAIKSLPLRRQGCDRVQMPQRGQTCVCVSRILVQDGV